MACCSHVQTRAMPVGTSHSCILTGDPPRQTSAVKGLQTLLGSGGVVSLRLVQKWQLYGRKQTWHWGDDVCPHSGSGWHPTECARLGPPKETTLP